MAAENGNEPGLEIEDVSFEDAENYVQRRRQKEILDAVKDALDTRRAAREEMARGEIKPGTCREVLRISVEHLIAEVEHMVKRVGEMDLWSNVPLGDPIVLFPPGQMQEFLAQDDVQTVGEPDLAPKKIGHISGLKGYRDANKVFTATWTINVETRHSGPSKEEFTTYQQMPLGISEAAISHTKGFLGRCSLGIDARLDDYTGDEGPGI